MSRKRLSVFLLAASVAVLWSAQALFTHVVRLENQPVLQAIRNGEKVSTRAVAASMAAYQSALKWSPCNASAQADLALLAAYEADRAMAKPEEVDEDAKLDALRKIVMARLACSPRDGKAWLDVAMLDVVRQGATPQTLAAYRMSALAAPGEAWLAKKRLEFALALLPLFSATEFEVARSDLATLERAHPNNMMAVQTAAKVESKEALYALFGAKAPAEETP